MKISRVPLQEISGRPRCLRYPPVPFQTHDVAIDLDMHKFASAVEYIVKNCNVGGANGLTGGTVLAEILLPGRPTKIFPVCVDTEQRLKQC